jgi:ELWxxDGT repeat protein
MKKIILLVLLQLPLLLNAQISILKKFQGSGNTYVHSLMKYNNQLYFYADDATLGTGLWKTDGTEAGTVFVKATGMIHTYGEVASQPVVSGGLLYFTVNNSQLWRTDGTSNGTIQLTDGSFNVTYSEILKIDLNGILVFIGTDADGDEIWRSDGSVTGTYKITDFYAGSHSGILGRTMAKQGNYIYFIGGTNQIDVSSRLCRTDGTAAGTQVVTNSGYGVSNLAVLGDKIVYSAQIDYTVICVGLNNFTWSTRKIMKVENGICSVLINPVTYHEGVYPNGSYCTYFGSEFGDSYYFRKSGNRLFFKARNYPVPGGSYYTTTETLWTTDGNTSQVLKVFPSTTLDSYGNNEAINNTDFNRGEYNETSISESVFYFSSGDNTTGFELWRSDGTISGTYLLKDINSGSGSSFPTSFKTIGNTTYFYAAYNGSNSKLFKTDGTATGTIEVTDPNLVLSYPLVNASNSKYSNNIGNKYIFVGKPSDNSGTALFSVCTTPIAPVVTSSVGSSICVGSSTTLTAAGCSGTVNWSTGATTSSIP